MPKVDVKSKNAVVNTVKDAKAVVKDNLVKKAVETKLGTEQGQAQSQKADTEAAESVESAAYTTADTVYHKGKPLLKTKSENTELIMLKQRKNILTITQTIFQNRPKNLITNPPRQRKSSNRLRQKKTLKIRLIRT